MWSCGPRDSKGWVYRGFDEGPLRTTLCWNGGSIYGDPHTLPVPPQPTCVSMSRTYTFDGIGVCTWGPGVSPPYLGRTGKEVTYLSLRLLRFSTSLRSIPLSTSPFASVYVTVNIFPDLPPLLVCLLPDSGRYVKDFFVEPVDDCEGRVEMSPPMYPPDPCPTDRLSAHNSRVFYSPIVVLLRPRHTRVPAVDYHPSVSSRRFRPPPRRRLQ